MRIFRCAARVFLFLRGAFQERNTLRFHTDIRSEKIEFIKNNNEIYFLFYNKERKIQVRAAGNAIIHYKNKTTEEAWKKTQVISRKCYLASNAPGTRSEIPTSGIPESFNVLIKELRSLGLNVELHDVEN